MDIDIVVFPTANTGGAENILHSIARSSARSGRFVLVIFLSSSGERVKLPRRCHGLYLNAKRKELGLIVVSRYIFHLSRRFCLKRVFSSHVHVNSFLCLYRSLKILKCDSMIIRESTVIGDRYHGFRKFEFKFLYLMYNKIDLLICQTDYMKTRLMDFSPKIINYHVEVIPNPVNARRVQSMSEESAPEIIGLGNQYIVSLGRLIETKGGDVLIRSFARIHRDFPGLKLLFLGDGPERNAWIKLANELDVSAHVIFGGETPNPFPYLKQSQLGVVASRSEGFPNVLLEMMCVCRRVVSTRCAGGVERLPGIYHCLANQEKELADCLNRALNCDSKKRIDEMRIFVNKRTPEDFWSQIIDLI